MLEQELWRIDVKDDGDVLKVVAEGELDITTSAELLNAFADANGHRALVCDLAALTFIDSTGIQALLTLQQREPDRFALSATSECVDQLLKLTGTSGVFRRVVDAGE